MMEKWDDSKLSSKLALLRENPSNLHPSEARSSFVGAYILGQPRGSVMATFR